MKRKKHPYSAYGQKLKIELIRRGITQRELAKRTGISHKVISDMIHGKYGTKENMEAIRRCLKEWGDQDEAV